MQAALQAAKLKFSIAQIWVPIFNFSRVLRTREQNQLHTLNTHIQMNSQHIPSLPMSDFSTDYDNIHWPKETTENMQQHWLNYLK